MYNQPSATARLGERATFLLVFAAVSAFFALGSIAIVLWIRGQLVSITPPATTSPIYTNYNPGGDYQQTKLWTDAQTAYQQYVQQYPQPQNVQVLTGLSTAQIYGYMVSQVAGGLKVPCQYCHNVQNFADDSNPQKVKARQMMLMVQDLNQNFVSKLPASVGGKQIICATCHNGVPVNFNGGNTGAMSNYPADQSPLPQSYQLPLDNLDVLLITGKKDPNLAAVQLNQYTMNHMTQSLGVGCAFCHNAQYFPSNERAEKGYALTMLQMAQHINNTYKPIMNQKAPSCWMCHRNQQLPPGSANPGQIPPTLGYTPSQ